jgi:hypothetical protein
LANSWEAQVPIDAIEIMRAEIWAIRSHIGDLMVELERARQRQNDLREKGLDFEAAFVERQVEELGEKIRRLESQAEERLLSHRAQIKANFDHETSRILEEFDEELAKKH